MDDAIAPEQCAFLIAIPLDRAAFDRACARRSDFLAINRFDGWGSYAPIAQAVDTLADAVRGHGATVLRDAGRAELAGAARDYRVIGLLAHLRYPPLSLAEIRDADAFERLVRTSAAAEMEMLRACAPGATVAEWVETAELLCRATDEDYDGQLTTGPGRLFGALGDARFGLTRFDRARFEELCGPLLEPAGAVELADGMCTTPEFVGCLPPEAPRLLDLSLCRSVILGSAVRRARPRIPSLVGRRLLNPQTGVLLWQLQVAELRRAVQLGRSIRYQDAVLRVNELLANQARS